jgi:phosphate:Na+ symporter
MAPAANVLEYGAIITGLIGGLALFLYGMKKMAESLKVAAGGAMKKMLARLTSNRFSAALAGAVITAVVQSSSVTTVLVVGFISAGILGLSQSIGVIIGANVGATVATQIIAFQITKYSLLMIAAGFIVEIAAKNKRIKHFGAMIMGLGFVFFGMELMSQATYPLRSYQPFIEILQSMSNPLLGILIGTAFTALIQSSAATTGIVIVLAGQGLLSLEAGIALVLGSNIGTCVTALISAIGRPTQAIRAAAAHIIFNIVGVALCFYFIPQFADLVRDISPVTNGLTGLAKAASEAPRQIANANSIFNVANAVIFIWFTGPLALFVKWIIPGKPKSKSRRIEPMYLDKYYFDQPELALERAQMELIRLGGLVNHMIEDALSAVAIGKKEDLKRLLVLDDDVDFLHEEIVAYLGELSSKILLDPQSTRIHQLVAVANYIENIGDVIETSMYKEGRNRLDSHLVFEVATQSFLGPVIAEAVMAYELALNAIVKYDPSNEKTIKQSKIRFRNHIERCQNYIVSTCATCKENLAMFKLLSDILTSMERIHALSRRIVSVLEENPGQQQQQQKDVDAEKSQ